jgi:hypothetical protein
MDDRDRSTPDQEPATAGNKRPFIEPEIQEFDDLEKQIKAPLIGTFTP